MPGFALTKPLPAAVVAVALAVCSSAAAAPGRGDARGSPQGLAPAEPPAVVAAAVPPANDELATATVIGGLPFSEALSTVEATTNLDDPVCVDDDASVWYAYTPPTTAWLTADTIGSDYDTTLGAYTGTPGDLTEVACNDDAVGLRSRISFLAEAGVTYYLLAAGWDGGGNLVLSLAQAGPFAKIPVKASQAREITPAAAVGWIAWARGARRNFRFWELFAQGSEGTVRVNRARTHGFAGGFDDGTLVYQEVRGRQSNLQRFDLLRETRSGLPAGVNTRHWEWHPTISGDWLLFGRSNRASRTDAVFLRNLADGRTILLDRRRWGTRRIAEPGQVNGDYAVWFRCTPRCDVFLHDIAQGTTTKVPNPQARQQYDPSVTSDGTVYFVQSGRGCGTSVRLVRQPLGGSAEVLTSLGAGRDSFHTFALEHGEGTSVFFESVRCSNGASDVLRLVDP